RACCPTPVAPPAGNNERSRVAVRGRAIRGPRPPQGTPAPAWQTVSAAARQPGLPFHRETPRARRIAGGGTAAARREAACGGERQPHRTWKTGTPAPASRGAGRLGVVLARRSQGPPGGGEACGAQDRPSHDRL